MKFAWMIVILFLELLTPLLAAEPPVASAFPEITDPVLSPSPAPVATGNLPPAYTLDHTEVLPIHAAKMDRDYQVLVSLPRSYPQQPNHFFPVVFVTDADYLSPCFAAWSGA